MSDILSMWNDPHARHAMLIHFPIVLCAIGILPLIALALTRFRSTPVKLICVGWFVLASFGAFMAGEAGEDAADGVEHAAVPLSPEAEAMLEEHEELGELGWLWPLFPSALVALTLVPARHPAGEGPKPKRRLQVSAGLLAMAASLGVSAWVAITADHGGRLVYVYSVGVPTQTGVRPLTTPERSGTAASPRKHDHDDDD